MAEWWLVADDWVAGGLLANKELPMTQKSNITDKQQQEDRSPGSPFTKIFLYLGFPGLARTYDRKALTAEQHRASSNRFLLQVVQPGLAGLMDGSVSTLAPIFAAAFATHRPITAFLVGMAAATGAGISMAFSEALSDNGLLTGRGNPVKRGTITGLMTFVGGSGHTLPFLVSDFRLALIIAYVVVAIELIAIAAIRHQFFGTRWLVSIMQVVGGGLLVVAAGLIFGSA